MIRRLIKAGDALSQFCNVAFLPNHHQTNANESISGRAYRQKWTWVRASIDLIFSPFERNHCRKAYEADLKRAYELLKGLNRCH